MTPFLMCFIFINISIYSLQSWFCKNIFLLKLKFCAIYISSFIKIPITLYTAETSGSTLYTIGPATASCFCRWKGVLHGNGDPAFAPIGIQEPHTTCLGTFYTAMMLLKCAGKCLEGSGAENVCQFLKRHEITVDLLRADHEGLCQLHLDAM